MQHTQPRAFLRQTSWMTRLLVVATTLSWVSTVKDAHATPATFIFTPPNPGWVVVLNGGTPVTDIQGDAPGSRDIVGDAANPVLYVASDATHMYFRLRVNSDPRQNATNFGPYGWGCLINTDSDRTTFEYSTIVDGVNNPDQILFYTNTVTTIPNSLQDPPDMPPVDTTLDPLTAAVEHAQVTVAGSNFGGDADYFVSWAVDLAPLLAVGFNPANPASYYCGSANNGMNLGGDCSGGPACGTLESQFNDPIGCGASGCAVCGDSQKSASEGCDDGNQTNGDGCNSVCLLELGQPCAGVNTACASGYCDPAGNICACDQNSDCPAGQLCSTTPNPNICVNPGCGNFVIEALEGCDDGNTASGDGCSMACLLELGQPCLASGVCESGFCDPGGDICACDQNSDCPDGQECITTLDPNQCIPGGCGNGIVSGTEGCDDGNLMNGDGCTAQCLLELGESCDVSGACDSSNCDGTTHICVCDDNADCPMGQVCDTNAEPNVCVPSGCGNGVLETGEGCDDGNTMPGDGCNAACMIELGAPCTNGPTCDSGNCDGTTHTCVCDDDADCPMGQICDTNAEPNVCVPSGCGNGILETGEGCDDGNTMPGDGCNAACMSELGEPCTNGTTCDSSNCDGTTNTCVCNDDADCPKGQVCDTKADPHECVTPPDCTSDTQCAGGLFCDEPSGTCVECTRDKECTEGTCDEVSFTCVECVQNTDCPNGGTCTTTHTCQVEGVIVEGGGILCTATTVPSNDNDLPFALLGLLAIGMTCRRRR